MTEGGCHKVVIITLEKETVIVIGRTTVVSKAGQRKDSHLTY